MQVLRFATMATVVAVAVSAQVIVIPNGYSAVEPLGANGFPFGNTVATFPGLRILHVYDSSHFTLQGIATPVVITGLRWRAADVATTTTWTGGTYNQATVRLSTSPVDFLGASATWATNHGPDMTTVHNGPITVLPGAGNGVGVPGPFHVGVTFPPFVYDPTLGDLTIDVEIPTGSFVGGTLATLSTVTSANLTPPADARRVFSSSLYPNANGVDINVAVVEVTCLSANGLYAGFTADTTSGPSPLAVTFTDQSYTSDPGGITSWSWDFDGDNVIDSNLQNPSFVYNNCGSYSVTLTVTDASHPLSVVTRTDYIVTDNVTPSFTTSIVAGGVVQFTDTSVPVPTSWAWDLDGDTVVDSNLQNPVWNYGVACGAPVNVTLTVNRLCRGPFSTVQAVSATNTASSSIVGGNGNSSVTYVGNMFNISVTNPQGINICAMSVTPYSFAGAFTMSVYVTPTTYVGNNLVASRWRLIGTGTGTSTAGPFTNPTVVFVPLGDLAYLAPGDYGVAVYLNRTPLAATNIAYTNAPIGPFVNGDVTLFPSPGTAPGIATLGLFSGSVTASRSWNGRIHYSTIASGGDAGYGFFAPGCAGSMGVSNLVHANRPQLGNTLTVNATNLPLSVAIMMVGFSRTTSLFGALPLDAGPYGAPGCFGRVSPDVTAFLAGAGNTATWLLGIPVAPALIGLPLFNQALVPNPGFNTLGAVFSDASALIVGI